PSTVTASPVAAWALSGLASRAAITAPKPPSAAANTERRERRADGSAVMTGFPPVGMSSLRSIPPATARSPHPFAGTGAFARPGSAPASLTRPLPNLHPQNVGQQADRPEG